LENSLFGFKTNQQKLSLKSYQQLGLIYQGYLLARKTEALLEKENERKIIQKIELEEEKLKQLDKEKVNCQKVITIENIFGSLELVEFFIDFIKNKFTLVVED
jgi:fructosamine-3-kinase